MGGRKPHGGILYGVVDIRGGMSATCLAAQCSSTRMLSQLAERCHEHVRFLLAEAASIDQWRIVRHQELSG